MTDKTLQDLMQDRAAVDREIARRHLAAAQELKAALAAAKFGPLIEKLNGMMANLSPLAQDRAGNVITVATNVPLAIDHEIAVLEAASAEPVEPEPLSEGAPASEGV
jgi:hypothetical protein